MIDVNGQLSAVYCMSEMTKGFQNLQKFPTACVVARLSWVQLHSEETERLSDYLQPGKG